MSIVKLDQSAHEAIILELNARGLPPCVRIEIGSTGCCDASLRLRPDKADAVDLVEEVAGLKLLISPEVNALAGEVFISYIDKNGRSGFMITSQCPLNEWAGFAICDMEESGKGKQKHPEIFCYCLG